MTVRFHVELDRLPQTDQCADRIKDERYARDARNKEGMNNNSATEQGGLPDGVCHVVHPDIGGTGASG